MGAMVYVNHLALMVWDIEKMRHTLKDKQGNMIQSNKSKSSLRDSLARFFILISFLSR
jgi:hypothetical protein